MEYLFESMLLFKEIKHCGDDDFIDYTMEYIIDKAKTPQKQKLFIVIEKSLPIEEGEQKIKFRDIIYEDAFEKGKAVGMKLALEQNFNKIFAIRSLKEGINPRTVARASELPLDEVLELQQAMLDGSIE